MTVHGDGETCFWCKKKCGGTCLKVTGSTQMNPEDPAYFLLSSGHVSTPRVYRESCYICCDPEYAQMGLPLCNPCPACQNAGRGDGHVPADDEECDDCLYNAREDWETQSAGIPWVCDGRPRDSLGE